MAGVKNSRSLLPLLYIYPIPNQRCSMKKAFRQRMLIWLFAGLTGFPLALHAATYTVTTNAGTGAGSLWQADSEAE